MSTFPTPAQQRSVDAISAALRAQTGEITLSTQGHGQIDLTIQSPNQPFKITLTTRGEPAEFAYYDANEENCEPDGATTQGRWIDAEPDSSVSEALRTAVAAAAPTSEHPGETAAQAALTALSEQLLDLRDNADQRRTSGAAAYERAANLVRAARDTLPQAEATQEPPACPAPAEMRTMLGLPELPPLVVDDELTQALAVEFYWLDPERDARRTIISWGWSSPTARAAHIGNAQRVLDALINSKNPYEVPFAGVSIRAAHVMVAKRILLAATDGKAA